MKASYFYNFKQLQLTQHQHIWSQFLDSTTTTIFTTNSHHGQPILFILFIFFKF